MQGAFQNVYSKYLQPFQGQRYLFRLVGAGSEDCPKELSIEDHTLLVIAMDSKDIEPVVGTNY